MIKLIVENGQITGVLCDSPQEAADYARLMQSNKPLSSSTIPANRGFPSLKPFGYGTIVPNPALHDFAKKIIKLDTTSVTSSTLASTLNVAVQGLGPHLRGVGKKYQESYHRKLDDLIYREGRQGDESLWHINPDAVKKLIED